jgi:DNA-binding MurR/RpiR family transcriptional regulator
LVPQRVDQLFAASVRDGNLTPAQRRIARYIADHGDDVAFLNSIELAARVGVSQPSVTRFATAVGFSGYQAMIEAIREIVNARPSRPGEAANRMQSAIDHSIESLRFLREQLSDLTTLREAAELLAETQPMPVCGFRGSVPLASWFSFFVSKIHPAVMALWGSDSHMVEKMAQARLGGATAALIIAMPRYPQQAVITMQSAKREGLKVVLLVDSELSPLTQFADLVLAAPVNPDFVFDSQIGPVQLAAALLEMIADVHPDRTQQRLDKLEELAAEHEFFIEGR